LAAAKESDEEHIHKISTVLDATDENAIPMSLRTFTDHLPTGFVLSEKTLTPRGPTPTSPFGLSHKKRWPVHVHVHPLPAAIIVVICGDGVG
jgi:hypothetical protein